MFIDEGMSHIYHRLHNYYNFILSNSSRYERLTTINERVNMYFEHFRAFLIASLDLLLLFTLISLRFAESFLISAGVSFVKVMS